jgi:hypothetical protein
MFQSLCVTMLHQGLERTVRIALPCIACTDPIPSLVMLTSRRKKMISHVFLHRPPKSMKTTCMGRGQQWCVTNTTQIELCHDTAALIRVSNIQGNENKNG